MNGNGDRCRPVERCLLPLVDRAVGFRCLFCGRWADGKRRWSARILALGTRWGPGRVLGGFFALRIETSLQRLWCSIMRLLASNRVRGEFGRVREASRVWRQLRTHATRSSPYARPALLVQVCFLLLRFGGWCPPGGTPNVDKAISILSLVNPICCNAWVHFAFSSLEGSGIR